MDIDSKDFINLLRNRDRNAYKRVVKTYTKQIFNAALGLGFDPQSADELIQRVWVTFFEIFEKFEGRSSIRTFLFGILYKKALEFRRESMKSDQIDPIDEIVEERFNENGMWAKPPLDPEQHWLAEESLDLIRKCLESLPITQRMAFHLKEIQEEETSDICNILDVSVTHLGVLLFRARNRLRECFENKMRNVVSTGDKRK